MFLSQYKKLATNTFIFALGNLGSKAISFLLLPLFTHYMLPEHYGKLDVINTTLSLFLPFLSLGISEAVLRFSVNESDTLKTKNVLGNAVTLTFLSTFALLPLYFILSKMEAIKYYYFYFSALYLLSLLNINLRQFLRGVEKLIVYVLSDIISTITYVCFNIIFLVFLKMGLEGCLISTVLSSVVTLVYIFIAGRVYRYIRFGIDVQLLKEMLRYSLPLVPNGLMWWIMNVSDRYMLTFFLGYSATGLYSVSAKFPTIISLLYGIFFQAWQLSAMQEFGKEDFEIFFNRVFQIISGGLFIITSWFLVFIKPFMHVIVSVQYFESWKYVPFLLLGAVFSSLASFYGVIYTASKKSSGAMVSTVIGALVNFGINLFLIPVVGIQAASLSTFVAYLVTWLVRIKHVKKLAKIRLMLKNEVVLTILLLFQAVLLILSKSGFFLYISQVFLALIVTFFEQKIILIIISRVYRTFRKI